MSPQTRSGHVRGAPRDVGHATALVLKRGVSGPAAEEFLTGAGVSPATWVHARREWMARIAAHDDVRERYATLYQRAAGTGGPSGMLAADRDDLAGHV